MTYVPTRDAILSDVSNRLFTELNIDASGPGKAAGVLVRAFVDAMAGTSRILSDGLYSYYPTVAGGNSLDRIGQTFGVTRATQSQSFARDTDEAIFIKATKGSLRAVLGTAVPSGTEFSNTDGTKVFFVPADTPVPPNVNSMPVSVVSRTTGANASAKAGEITNHSLGTRIEVVNSQPIVNGSEIETDNTYRSRVLAAMRGGATASLEAMRSVASGISGVRKAITVPNVGGIGKFGIMLIPTGNFVSSATVETVRAILKGIAPVGIVPIILTPVYLPVKLEASIEFTAEASAERRRALKEQAKNIALQRLGNIQPNTRFNLQEMYRDILGTLGSEVLHIETQCFEVDGQETTNGVVLLGQREILVPANISNAVKFGG